ncbi:MAG: type II toxin-antitoxin system VapC family toxin [Nitrospirota bacterium]
MVLVDTSVWVDHLRRGTVGLERPLSEGQVLCHPFIIGELACGNLKNRSDILSLLHTLPVIRTAEEAEILQFIEKYRLMGKGLGYIDVHLLASSLLSHAPLWTLDKPLGNAAAALRIRYAP